MTASTRTCTTCGRAVASGVAVCPDDGTPIAVDHRAAEPSDFPGPAGGGGSGEQTDSTSGLSPADDPVGQTIVRRSRETGGTPSQPGAVFREVFATPLPPREDQPDGLVGTQVSEYVIRALVGEGGMGQVYEGVHPLIGKRVGIKVLRREVAANPEEGARLLTEARAANSIGHRGIIDIFGFGTLPDGRQYFVMEYLVGRPVAELIRQRAPLPVGEALQILDEILAPLGAAHAAGVIHRDLKPSNIFLVDQPDGTMFVKILDFGLAKQASTTHGTTPQTRMSRIIGTPEYMAPEQARGDAVGPRTDLYAVGVVAFELLTGALPFVAGTPWEIVTMHLTAAPPLVSSVVNGVPSDVDVLVARLLAKKASDRLASVEAVRAEVKRIRRALKLEATRLVMIPTEPERERAPTAPPVAAARPVAPPPTAQDTSSDSGSTSESSGVSSETAETVGGETAAPSDTSPGVPPVRRRKLPLVGGVALGALVLLAVAVGAAARRHRQAPELGDLRAPEPIAQGAAAEPPPEPPPRREGPVPGHMPPTEPSGPAAAEPGERRAEEPAPRERGERDRRVRLEPERLPTRERPPTAPVDRERVDKAKQLARLRKVEERWSAMRRNRTEADQRLWDYQLKSIREGSASQNALELRGALDAFVENALQ